MFSHIGKMLRILERCLTYWKDVSYTGQSFHILEKCFKKLESCFHIYWTDVFHILERCFTYWKDVSHTGKICFHILERCFYILERCFTHWKDVSHTGKMFSCIVNTLRDVSIHYSIGEHRITEIVQSFPTAR